MGWRDRVGRFGWAGLGGFCDRRTKWRMQRLPQVVGTSSWAAHRQGLSMQLKAGELEEDDGPPT
ncbi:hypothetical protein OsJ_35687 [Oryza sativa Japonica Group]|uniref:Uncharacterized protein n=2 Tax=Oryza sativa subsp. japonica TaxID=39947 RepID=A0A8J8YNY6_ORYSJ|nr:hypothetical protein LOC_Os12g13710 [Oryza sativa Japonica Group]EAZ20089.1 hypothetical protein OsJ_35687 [Oryza sativa Japonica Group]